MGSRKLLNNSNMFYAKGNVSEKIDIYLALLQKTISEGTNSNYWSFFTDAIITAHELASGTKNFYQVDRTVYDVVKILIQSNNQPYFKDLPVEKIGEKDFANKVFADIQTFMGSMKQANSVVD